MLYSDKKRGRVKVGSPALLTNMSKLKLIKQSYIMPASVWENALFFILSGENAEIFTLLLTSSSHIVAVGALGISKFEGKYSTCEIFMIFVRNAKSGGLLRVLLLLLLFICFFSSSHALVLKNIKYYLKISEYIY